MPELTAQQRAAATATGNVLVMAGAGTGKTRTLVERCLQRLLDPAHPVGLDQILVVTFTEAAAAEMRQRLRRGLEEAAARDPANRRLAEAAALVDAAYIGTLHSFCLRLLREHFHELGLDPQLSVLDPTQAELLAARTLDDLLRRHYAGAEPLDRAVQELALAQGDGRDDALRTAVRRLHDYLQTLPDPAGWLQVQRQRLAQAEPAHWRSDLLAAFTEWRREWLEHLAELAPANTRAVEARAVLEACGESPDRARIAAALAALLELDLHWPRGTKGKFRKPLEGLFDDARFLADLARVPPGGTDPLEEDWQWVRPHLQALLDLTEAFGAAFADAKRELAAVDFHDLEQFALRLLWDPDRGAPSDLARQWQARLAHVFVDEYQDINAAQDTILRALSRDGPAANRFLVGDVKQSIYRFRLANPHIFQEYAARWRGGPEGVCLPLNENFRSRSALLDFVNALFTPLMRREVGGVAYDAEAQLQPGPPIVPSHAGYTPPVELLLHLTGNLGQPAEADSDLVEEAGAELSAEEQEAAWIAARLAAWRAAGLPVRDLASGDWRPVTWNDMVVLLRAPRPRVEAYVRGFARLGVPLRVQRAGLYDTAEVRDLLELLQLLDNPWQDLPALAVLRGPFVGVGPDELAAIRLAALHEPFWTAVLRFHETAATDRAVAAASDPPELRAAAATAWPKVDRFLRDFARWREVARLGSLAHCLETIVDDTRYEDGLRLEPDGAGRAANVQRLLAVARDYGRQNRPGLLRFLEWVRAQQEAEFDPEPAPPDAADVVRLMSIHQSKGLEFPVVVVAGLGTKFNLRDFSQPLLLDEVLGPAPRVRPPHAPTSYPGLPHWRAARRGRRETLGEELRLLYVACTRARDHLLLSGTVSARQAAGWDAPEGPVSVARLLAVQRPLDWIGPLVGRLTGEPAWQKQPVGRGQRLAWRVVNVGETPPPVPAAAPGGGGTAGPDLAAFATAVQALRWSYPNDAATREPAKATVTTLRRRARLETDEEAVRWFARAAARGETAGATPDAVERGLAHHRFLEFTDWTRLTDAAAARREAGRLVGLGRLNTLEAAMLDFEALGALGGSDLGRAIRADLARVRRELAYTARLHPADFVRVGVPCAPGLAAEEFVVVQGVVDLAVVGPDHLWLADFKTDAVEPAEVEARAAEYAPQVRLYALALHRVFGRPVRGAWLYFLTPRRGVSVPLNGVG